jgi:hypothetical protein
MLDLRTFEPGLHSRRQFLRATAAYGSAIFGIFVAGQTLASTPLSWDKVSGMVKSTLATRQGYQPGDLISQQDVKSVLSALKGEGWEVSEQSKLLELVLEDSNFLVRQARSAAGTKFMRGVAGDKLPFDRLDRLSRMPGGQQLVQSIVHLPDGQALMGKHPTPGLGDLTELLPKQANGLTPVDKNFNKPTGRIYTEAELLTALEERWKKRS